MRIVAWGSPGDTTPTQIRPGDAQSVTITVEGGPKGLDIAYIVLLGHDDLASLADRGSPDAILARIISKLQSENAELRKAVVERDLLERLLVDRGWTDDKSDAAVLP